MYSSTAVVLLVVYSENKNRVVGRGVEHPLCGPDLSDGREGAGEKVGRR